MAKNELKILATAPSKSNPEKSYEIRRGNDGVVYCTCPAWRFQRMKKGERRSCKHLAAFFAGQLTSSEPIVEKSLAGRNLATHKRQTKIARDRDRAHRLAKKSQECA